MIRSCVALLAIAALSGLTAAPASAARSLTKSFKLSVTLPSVIGLPAESATHTSKTGPSITLHQTTEETVVRNHQTILLQTTVPK